MPSPPKQKESWDSNVIGISSNWISATKTLFELGLADPRGLDYREVDIVAGAVGSQCEVVHVHAWIIPSTTTNPPRYAVTWSGSVYPIVRGGPAANLATDIQALRNQKEVPSLRTFERQFVSEASFFPIKACLLLRLGEIEAARTLCEAAQKEQEKYAIGSRSFRNVGTRLGLVAL